MTMIPDDRQLIESKERADHLQTLVFDLEQQVASLEEELGRRYRELESVKARCSELEQELDYQVDDCRDLHRQRDQLMVELGDAVQSRLHAERRADEAERARRGDGW